MFPGPKAWQHSLQETKAACTRQTGLSWQTRIGIPKLACVNGKKQAANTFANCWRQIETCLPTVFMPFAHTNLSLPTRVCQLKFAVWRRLKWFPAIFCVKLKRCRELFLRCSLVASHHPLAGEKIEKERNRKRNRKSGLGGGGGGNSFSGK